MVIETVIVELIDICNLNCSYCLRDEASLHGKAHALPIPVLVRILADLKKTVDRGQVTFTGGEPTLHPDFRMALKAVQDLEWRYVVVTNGWNFRRVLPAVLEFRGSLEAMAFSFSGLHRAEHDRIRGQGSFDRVMQAVASCRQHGLPFRFKITVDRSKAAGVRDFVLFAARLGAHALEIAPLLPASDASRADVMSVQEQEEFLREIGLLRDTMKLPILIAAGFFDPRPQPTCGPLLGTTLNIDYHGRLTLCTVLAGFRAQPNDRDVIADLRTESVEVALPRFAEVVRRRNRERLGAFRLLGPNASRAPLRFGSHCFDCLCSFGKMLPGSFDSVQEKRPMDDHTSFLVADSIITSEFDGKEALLLDTATQRYYTLNETATFLWAAIEKGRTVAEMASSLLATFEVDEELARNSVVDALDRLESQNLIHRASAALQPSEPSATRGAIMIAVLSAILGAGLGLQPAHAQTTPPKRTASAKPVQASPPFVLKIKDGIHGTAEILAKQVETKTIVDRLKADLKIPIAASPLVAQHKVDLSLQGSSVVQLLLALAPVVLADLDVGASPEDVVWKRIHLIGYNEKEPARDLKPTGFLLAAGTINEDDTITLPDPDAEDKLAVKAMMDESEGDTPMLAVVVKDGRVTLKSRKQPLVALLDAVAKRATVPFDLRGQPDMLPIDIDLAELPLRDLPVALGRPGVRLIVRRNLATGEEVVQGIVLGEKRLPAKEDLREE